MKTTGPAINKVYSVLSASGSGLSIPVHKYNKPDTADDKEYVVINSLPISADVMQSCVVNVNYHIKDIKDGTPYSTKLESVSEAIIALLDNLIDRSYSSYDITIDFRTQDIYRENALNEHYSNIQFNVKIINK